MSNSHNIRFKGKIKRLRCGEGRKRERGRDSNGRSLSQDKSKFISYPSGQTSSQILLSNSIYLNHSPDFVQLYSSSEPILAPIPRYHTSDIKIQWSIEFCLAHYKKSSGYSLFYGLQKIMEKKIVRKPEKLGGKSRKVEPIITIVA